MRILSIGFGAKKKVKYEKANNAGITETYQLSTEDDFRPEILEAYVKARIRKCIYKLNKVSKVLDQWARSYYENTMQGLPIQRGRVSQ